MEEMVYLPASRMAVIWRRLAAENRERARVMSQRIPTQNPLPVIASIQEELRIAQELEDQANVYESQGEQLILLMHGSLDESDLAFVQPGPGK